MLTNHGKTNLSFNQSILNSIIAHIPCFIYWKDKNFIYQGCNERFAKAAGFQSPQEIIGKTDYELAWGKTEADIYRKDDQGVLTGQELLDYEETQLQADGRHITVLASKVPFRDESGNVIGVLGIYQDVSERKKIEGELAKTIADKTIAEAANNVKTEFLESMRHDICTPLTGITNIAKKIKEEASEPVIKGYADSVITSGDALRNFLNEIVETVRATSGAIPLFRDKFDLKQCLNDIVNLNRAKATEKKLDLLLEYDATAIPAYLIGDCKRLQRIVLELVTNALNFTHKGFVKLCARLAKKEGRNVVIKISISDTGEGIPLEKQQEVFLRFKRSSCSKGAGLGLAVIKQFMDDLEGEIYVDSRLNVGTTFTCVIPLKEALLEKVD